MGFNLDQFYSSVDNILSHIPNKIAVFDADGTLWKEDIGFGFFEYQIKNSLLQNPPSMKFIHQLYKTNPRKVCSLIVQINQGVFYKQYISWCNDYLKSNPVNVFSFQRKIINFLKDKNVDIYVVSASPEWVVNEAIRYYSLKIDHVIGLKTVIEKSTITDQLCYPLSIADGKSRSFLQRSKNIYPFFSASNTVSDLDLLELATHLKLVVASAPIGHKHYDSERVLLSIAHQKSWLYNDLLDTE